MQCKALLYIGGVCTCTPSNKEENLIELHEFIVHIPKRQKISIIPIGDLHIGTKACSIDKLKDLIKWIAGQKDVYVIGMGDYVDAINLSDPRFSLGMLAANYSLDKLAQQQTEEAIRVLMPIKDKLIGLGTGNHEMALTKHYHYDPMYELCKQLNTKYLGWSSLTRLRIVRTDTALHRQTFVLTLFAEHSRACGRKKGSKVNALEDRSNDIEADIYLRGHSHDKVATTSVQLYLPKSGELKVGVKKRVYAICPSFYNTYPEGAITYGEVAGYPPTTTGVIKIDIEVKYDDTIDYHLYQ